MHYGNDAGRRQHATTVRSLAQRRRAGRRAGMGGEGWEECMTLDTPHA